MLLRLSFVYIPPKNVHYIFFENKETDHYLIHSLKYLRCTLPGRLHRYRDYKTRIGLSIQFLYVNSLVWSKNRIRMETYLSFKKDKIRLGKDGMG